MNEEMDRQMDESKIDERKRRVEKVDTGRGEVRKWQKKKNVRSWHFTFTVISATKIAVKM